MSQENGFKSMSHENGFKSMTKLLHIAVADANLATVKFPSLRQRKACVRVHSYLIAYVVFLDVLIDQEKN